MIDRVLVHASSLSDNLTHLASDTANKTRRTWPRSRLRFVRKNSIKITIVNSRPFEVVALTFTSIVFTQRQAKSRQRFNLGPRSVSWFCPCYLCHQLIDVLELAERRPTFITTTPLRTRRQPHGKSFSEIFRRMRLR